MAIKQSRDVCWLKRNRRGPPTRCSDDSKDYMSSKMKLHSMRWRLLLVLGTVATVQAQRDINSELIAAVRADNSTKVRELLALGANPNHRGRGEETPLSVSRFVLADTSLLAEARTLYKNS